MLVFCENVHVARRSAPAAILPNQWTLMTAWQAKCAVVTVTIKSDQTMEVQSLFSNERRSFVVISSFLRTIFAFVVLRQYALIG